MTKSCLQALLLVFAIAAVGRGEVKPLFDRNVYLELTNRGSVSGALIGPEFTGRNLSQRDLWKIAGDRFVAAAAAANIPESEVTRAMFEGRFNPTADDMWLVRFAFGSHEPMLAGRGSGQSWSLSCQAFNQRFGTIGALPLIQTVFSGKDGTVRKVTLSGKDLLLRLARRLDGTSTIKVDLSALPIHATYDEAVTLLGDRKQELDVTLTTLNQDYCAWRYFDWKDLGDGSHHLYGDYEALRHLDRPPVSSLPIDTPCTNVSESLAALPYGEFLHAILRPCKRRFSHLEMMFAAGLTATLTTKCPDAATEQHRRSVASLVSAAHLIVLADYGERPAEEKVATAAAYSAGVSFAKALDCTGASRLVQGIAAHMDRASKNERYVNECYGLYGDGCKCMAERLYVLFPAIYESEFSLAANTHPKQLFTKFPTLVTDIRISCNIKMSVR